MGDTERRARVSSTPTPGRKTSPTTPAGHQAAEAARKDYEQHGVRIAQLHRVAEHSHDRTILADCMKVYVPALDGRFGMIFILKFQPDRHPQGSQRPTVYHLPIGALHGQPPSR